MTKDDNLGYFTSALTSSHFARPAHAKVPKRRKRRRSKKKEQEEDTGGHEKKGTKATKLLESNEAPSESSKSVASPKKSGLHTPNRSSSRSQENAESTPVSQMSLQRKLSQQTPELRRQQEQENSLKFETPMAPPPSLQRRSATNEGANSGFSPLRSIANLQGSEPHFWERPRQRQLRFGFGE